MCYMHIPGLGRERYARATSQFKRGLVKTSAARVVMRDNCKKRFFFPTKSSCPANSCPERNSCPIFLKLSQNVLCNVYELMLRFEEDRTSLNASLDRPPEALENGSFGDFFGCPAIGCPELKSQPIFLKLSQNVLCNVFEHM